MSFIETRSYPEQGSLKNGQQRLFSRIQLLRDSRSVEEMPFGENWWKVRPGDMVVADRTLVSKDDHTGFIVACGVGPFVTAYRMYYSPQVNFTSSTNTLVRSLSTPMVFERNTVRMGTKLVDFKPKDKDDRVFLFEEKDLTILRPRGVVRDMAQKYTKYVITSEILKGTAITLLLGSTASSGFFLTDFHNREMYMEISATGFVLGLSALFAASQFDIACQKILMLMGDRYRDYFPADFELQGFFQRVFLPPLI